MPNGEASGEQPKQTGEIRPPTDYEDKMNWMWGIIVAIIIILVMGFVSLLATVGTLVWNAQMFGANTYQALVKELDTNNTNINTLINKIDQNNCVIPQKIK